MKVGKRKLKEIGTTMANELKPIFGSLTAGNQVLQDTDVSELGDWYARSKDGRDGLLSKVANSLVENLMTKLPQQFVQVSIEDIEIDTSSAQPGAKFSPTFSKSIKPYVEIQFWVGPVKSYSARFTFEIKFDGTFENMEIKNKNGKMEICLGKFVSNVTVSIVKIVTELEEPRVIGSKEITVDLSQHCIKI